MLTKSKYSTLQGKTLDLGSRLGTGGEGDVFALTNTPDIVAKIYHRAPDKDKVAKLKAMVATGGSTLPKIATWPLDIIADSKGVVTGFTMPRLDRGYKEMVQLYSPAHRKQLFKNADYAFLVHAAMNCAAAFETVHAAGHVIGDVNQKNVVVNNEAIVKLIDCDSFQISGSGHIYPCVVGVGEYLAPELHGKDFSRTLRCFDTDNFGLAVLIFHLLFMGRHPYAGRFVGSKAPPTIEEAVEEYRYAYATYAVKLCEMQPPPNSLPIQLLPPQMRDMLERAFLKPAAASSASFRPDAKQWAAALRGMKESLFVCKTNKMHKYPSHLTACPWCEMERKNIVFFIGVQIKQALTGAPTALNIQITMDTKLVGDVQDVLNRINARLHSQLRFTQASALPVRGHLKHSKRLKTSIGICTVLGIIFGLCGWMGAAGWVVNVILIWWWATMSGGSAYDIEMKTAKGELAKYERERTYSESLWEQKRKELESDISSLFDDTESDLLDYEGIPETVKQELDTIDDRMRRQQLDVYLRAFTIERTNIQGIGLQRTAQLRSFGIETAADVSEQRIMAISGFGAKYTRALMQWRWKVEAKFQYKPNAQSTVTARNDIQAKYAKSATTLAGKLRQALPQLERFERRIESELGPLEHQLIASTHQVSAMSAYLAELTKI